ncbi:MAG: deoxyribodipyrimidine photo-lyase [Actinomycetales bacterium]|nr:deoxyribodipyrimidine photo-lyase [Actinomycetales bacterium]
MTRALLWFRRDLRLRDHPALLRAVTRADEVLPVFVPDPVLLRPGGTAGPERVGRLLASVAALREATGDALVIRAGAPETVIPRLAAEVGAAEVHVTGETTPYGRARDARVAEALAGDGRALVRTGTPCAVDPGVLRTRAGTPYRVFTPFLRAWRARGLPRPAPDPEAVRWLTGVDSEELRLPGGRTAARSPATAEPAGEEAALRRWRTYLSDGLARYHELRDRPDLDATSRMSVALAHGEVHPRTLLADLATAPAPAAAVESFTAELCWREFSADVLWHEPGAARRDLRPGLAGLAYDSPDDSPAAEAAVTAWRTGRTGYPFVDAGMRQLLAEGFVHNRARMVTASFLVKDLHLWWPVGARHFLRHLRDADVASNSLGWQWVAGTGTDAAPYVRVFNPVSQGLRFDPDGTYVRRWVPELAHLPGAAVHEPWRHPEGLLRGYPSRIVDHEVERREALARHEAARG